MIPYGMGAHASSVEVVENIYRDLGREPFDRWLQRVAAQIATCFGAGLGALAHTYDLGGAPSDWRISRPVVHEAPDELASVVVESFARSTPEFLDRCYRGVGPAGSFSELVGIDLSQLPADAGAAATRLGIIDQVFVNGANADDRGVLIAVNVRKRTRLVPAQRQRLAMLAAHVAAAARLAQGALGEPVGIFDPEGRAAHLEAEQARGSLRERVAAALRARAVARRDDAAALFAWKALLAGRYTLVDRFESDGKRFVLAFENAPTVRDPRGLTEREAVVAALASRGHSDKLIAYELGVATGTVTALISRVLRKMTARTRTEMVQRLKAPIAVDRVAVGDAKELVVLTSPEPAPPSSFASLPSTERIVATLAARGESNDAIARRRGVSPGTIAKQLTSIYRKLGVTSRVDLARLLE